jgi:hypothetical protein
MISVARWSPWLSSQTVLSRLSLSPPRSATSATRALTSPVAPRDSHGRSRYPKAASTAMRRFSRTDRLRKHLGNLKCARNTPPDAARRQRLGDVLAVEQDAARCRRQKSAGQVEERGLAGAIGADDRAQLSGLDRHRNVVDRDETAEPARDALDLDKAHKAALL